MFARAGQLLDERCSGYLAAQLRAVLIAEKVDDCKQIRIGPDVYQGSKHALGTGVTHQPVVDNSNSHGRSLL